MSDHPWEPGSDAEAGYLAQIEGLQRELRDANEAARTAWAERDDRVKEAMELRRLLRDAIGLLAYFAGRPT